MKRSFTRMFVLTACFIVSGQASAQSVKSPTSEQSLQQLNALVEIEMAPK